MPLSPRKLRPTRPAPQPPTSVASPVLETRLTSGTYGTLPGSTDLDGVPFALNPRLTHLNCVIVSVLYQFSKEGLYQLTHSRFCDVIILSSFLQQDLPHIKMWTQKDLDKEVQHIFSFRSYFQIYSYKNKRTTWFFLFLIVAVPLRLPCRKRDLKDDSVPKTSSLRNRSRSIPFCRIRIVILAKKRKWSA